MASTRLNRWLATTVQFLGLLSAAEAVTLSQFQAISPNQIPANCLSVYTATINGCIEADFTSNAACSAKCLQGLKTKEAQVQVFCANLEVNPRSLIGITLSGGLLQLLCPGQQAAPSIPGFSTIPLPSSTKATTEPPATTRSSSTTDPKDPQQTTTTTSQPEQSPTLVPPPSSTSSTTATTRENTSGTPSLSTSTTTSVRPQSTTAGANPAPTQVSPPEDNSGGDDDDADDTSDVPQAIEQNGSPFANINTFFSAGHITSVPPTWTAMALATLFAGVLLGA
ncbi:uncharacterized protein B0I36DRAFT_345968 [Microdochium trichocladiopsis]|uniref:Extracellular membrane protein CFEM domain-containing protein n=1 Tax=Microdochium trichocladiopsis TaxID=1682393 RepID=A0A9P9BUX5_9PEZI|nr:uncharacterized protein B0I36DRAFT_345968 [Microdochium trichocladiopsis]KAH7037919.1 hypothetical protein B0I36DRAFT_345968 [Microdochium trichocladiopsis]